MKKITLVTLLLFVTPLIFSQEAVTASGGEASGTGGTASFSVGQLVYTTIGDAQGTVAQGVQQSEIAAEESITVLDNDKPYAYPNPVKDVVTLMVPTSDFKNLRYVMMDFLGRHLKEGPVVGKSTPIPVDVLEGAHYYVKVFRSDELIKTLKFIKEK